MKCLTLVVLLAFLVTLFAGSSQAIYCPCDLNIVSQICGTNGMTYRNSCEFECMQQVYKNIGRTLNMRKEGRC